MPAIPNLNRLIQAKATVSLNVVWDGRKRINKTEAAINGLHDRSTTNYSFIADSLPLLKDGDFIVFYPPDDKDCFIQYCNQYGSIYIDVPIMFNQGEVWYKKALLSHLLNQRKIFEKQHLLNFFVIRGKYWYELGYIGEGENQTGETIDACFNDNFVLAAETGLEIFRKLYDKSSNHRFNFIVASHDDGWLNQL